MTKKLLIEGMTCGHCVRHVEEALNELEAVTSVKADLEGKNAVVELSREVSDAAFKEIIEEVGYELIAVETV